MSENMSDSTAQFSSNQPLQLDDSPIERLVISQGYGGETLVNIRNFNAQVAPLTSILSSMAGVRGRFLEKIGGGGNRGVYVSTGDVNNDGVADIVLSFASLTDAAEFPNVIVPRQQTGEVIGHSFQPFPPGDDLLVNYNGGEAIRSG